MPVSNQNNNRNFNQMPVTGPFGKPLSNLEGVENEVRVVRSGGSYSIAVKSGNVWRYISESGKASSTTLGLIKVGSGLSIDADGKLTATGASANNYLDGITRDGNTLTFSVSGSVGDQPYEFGSNAFTSYTDHSLQGYLTGNELINFTGGDVTGSGTTSVTLSIGTDKVNDTHIDWGTGTNQVNTDDIPQGSTNLWASDETIDDRVNALIQDGTGIAFLYDDNANTLTANVTLSGLTTDDLTDTGATNKYYTNALARASLSASAPISYNSSTGAFSVSDHAITLAKVQEIATNSFLGRNDASTGDIEVLSISDVETMLGLNNFIESASIHSLTDTAITLTSGEVADEDLLIYDRTGSKWKNRKLVESDIPTLAKSKISTSGTWADGDISEGSVTQHESALSITESQISDFGTYDNYSSWTVDAYYNSSSNTTTIDSGNTVQFKAGTGASISHSATSAQMTIEYALDLGSVYLSNFADVKSGNTTLGTSASNVGKFLRVSAQGTDPETYYWDAKALVASDIPDISATKITSGTLPNARIQASGVTQHESSIDHDALTGFVADEHIDWTTDQGATNIHSGNYTNTSQATEFYLRDSVPTTYTIGHGKYIKFTSSGSNSPAQPTLSGSGTDASPYTLLTQYRTYASATTSSGGLMSSGDKTKLDGIAVGATNVTNNNQITNGANYISGITGQVIGSLSNVDSSAPSNNQILKYNTGSSTWIVADNNPTMGNISTLSDVTVTSPSDAQVLQWQDATDRWVNATLSLSYLPLAGGTMDGNVTVSKALPKLVLDSPSSGDNWTSQGAQISLGESGDGGSASLHLTYRGDGYGYIGMGVLPSTGIPPYSTIRFKYNSNQIYMYSNPSIAGNANWHAGNDGSGSGLDADTVDGVQGSSFLRSDTSDTASGSYSFTNSYNEFGNSTGSVSNDGGWNARLNLAGSSHARLDVKSVSDGIITTMYAHTGHGAGRVGTMSNHKLILMTNGSNSAELSTSGSLSTTSQGTLWGTSNDGSGSGLDADLLDGQHGSYYTNAGNLTGTIPDVFSASTRYNIGLIDGSGSQTRDKIRVWDSATYAIGMKTGYTYGHLGNEYAMSFQMNNDSTRGFWWGNSSHSDAQGAMSLTTNGRLTVATSLSVGQGETVTSPSSEVLYVGGNASFSGDVTIDGSSAWNAGNGMLNVGGTGDARIQVRHIWGKDASTAGTDHLWLQYANSGKHVQIGNNSNQNLYVRGNIYQGGYFGGNQVLDTSNYSSYALPKNGGTLSGELQRNDHATGYFVGSYNNVAANSTKTNPIYVIGSNYQPSNTALSNMYGIGYSHGNFWGGGSGKPTGWGMYAAADGDVRCVLDASAGTIWASGSMKVGTSTVLHTGNYSSYALPLSGSSSSDVQVKNLSVRGDLYSSSVTSGCLTFWSSGGTTTSRIQFKPTSAGSFGNHGYCDDNYNTYFDMDSTGRGWVFRNATTSTNIFSISNRGEIYSNGKATFSGETSSNTFKITQSGAKWYNINAHYLGNNTWIQSSGAHFLYAPNSGYGSSHWYAGNNGSHGAWRMVGSSGGYGGFKDDHSGVSVGMHDSAGNGGTYRIANGRWHTYHHVSNNCLGINNSATSVHYGLYVTGAIYATGDVVAYSDARIKTNVKLIDNPLDKVMAMRGVYYNRIDEGEDTSRKEIGKRCVGMIAQELNEVLPEAVTYAKDIDRYGIDYGKVTGLLIEAIKELKNEINELRGEA